MTDELKPLTPEQQAEFESRRQSDAVIQTKCPSCNAWYETNRLSKTFTETFNCDCGHKITLEVPAVPIIVPSSGEILAALDPDATLDTGLKVQEALARASAWWSKTGRKEMKLHAKRQKHSPASSTPGLGGAFADLDPDSANFLPSNIIQGAPWDQLDKREKLLIVKVWHHHFIRVPDKIGPAEGEAIN